MIKGHPSLAQINSSLFSTEITAIAYAPTKSLVAKCVALNKSFLFLL